MSNQLTQMAREILAIEADLPQRFDYSNGEKPSVNDFELHTFDQIWGSTALGFGGIGGQAMTAARTYVFVPISCNQKCFVYFAGRFAYFADYTSAFQKDLFACQMASVTQSGKYKKREGN